MPSLPMSLVRTVLEVSQLDIRTVSGGRNSPVMIGFTRKTIGATFEGQTKEGDGTVFADVEAEGVPHDVCDNSTRMSVPSD